jgi:hypothetical protein
MKAELPNFIQPPHIEGAKSSGQGDSQSAPAERKRGRSKLTEAERKRRKAEQNKRHHYHKRRQQAGLQAEQPTQVFPPHDEQP